MMSLTKEQLDELSDKYYNSKEGRKSLYIFEHSNFMRDFLLKRNKSMKPKKGCKGGK